MSIDIPPPPNYSNRDAAIATIRGWEKIASDRKQLIHSLNERLSAPDFKKTTRHKYTSGKFKVFYSDIENPEYTEIKADIRKTENELNVVTENLTMFGNIMEEINHPTSDVNYVSFQYATFKYIQNDGDDGRIDDRHVVPKWRKFEDLGYSNDDRFGTASTDDPDVCICNEDVIRVVSWLGYIVHEPVNTMRIDDWECDNKSCSALTCGYGCHCYERYKMNKFRKENATHKIHVNGKIMIPCN